MNVVSYLVGKAQSKAWRTCQDKVKAMSRHGCYHEEEGLIMLPAPDMCDSLGTGAFYSGAETRNPWLDPSNPQGYRTTKTRSTGLGGAQHNAHLLIVSIPASCLPGRYRRVYHPATVHLLNPICSCSRVCKTADACWQYRPWALAVRTRVMHAPSLLSRPPL